MSRSKEQFMEVRHSTSNHYDKARERYWKSQGADYEQIEHISGDQKKWK